MWKSLLDHPGAEYPERRSPAHVAVWDELHHSWILSMVPRKTGGWSSWRETGRRPLKVDPRVLHAPGESVITLDRLQ